jgi:hypothetical protein
VVVWCSIVVAFKSEIINGKNILAAHPESELACRKQLVDDGAVGKAL